MALDPATIEYWDDQIAKTTVAIDGVTGKAQAWQSGGPAQGAHTQLANLRELQGYLTYCIQERNRLKVQTSAGINRVVFGEMF